jgi:uncharacterized Zn-finger protein
MCEKKSGYIRVILFIYIILVSYRLFDNLSCFCSCDLCGNSYFKKKNLDKHMSIKHKIDSKRHICATCGKEFSIAQILKTHQWVHIPLDKREKKFICHICGER